MATAAHHPPIRDLIPHQAPMIWLDALIDWRPGYARCRTRIRSDGALVEEGSLATVALIEHMAQAVAACLGYGALQSGEDIRVGMIVACRTVEFDRVSVAVGTELTVEAERLREVDAVSNFRCQVLDGETRVASAHMTLYHAAEPPQGA